MLQNWKKKIKQEKKIWKQKNDVLEMFIKSAFDENEYCKRIKWNEENSTMRFSARDEMVSQTNEAREPK